MSRVDANTEREIAAAVAAESAEKLVRVELAASLHGFAQAVEDGEEEGLARLSLVLDPQALNSPLAPALRKIAARLEKSDHDLFREWMASKEAQR